MPDTIKPTEVQETIITAGEPDSEVTAAKKPRKIQTTYRDAFKPFVEELPGIIELAEQALTAEERQTIHSAIKSLEGAAALKVRMEAAAAAYGDLNAKYQAAKSDTVASDAIVQRVVLAQSALLGKLLPSKPMNPNPAGLKVITTIEPVESEGEAVKVSPAEAVAVAEEIFTPPAVGSVVIGPDGNPKTVKAGDF